MEPSKEALIEFWRICQETDQPVKNAVGAAIDIDLAPLRAELQAAQARIAELERRKKCPHCGIKNCNDPHCKNAGHAGGDR